MDGAGQPSLSSSMTVAASNRARLTEFQMHPTLSPRQSRSGGRTGCLLHHQRPSPRWRASATLRTSRRRPPSYLAGRINRPVLLEGPAGAGKTELAQVGRTRLWRVPAPPAVLSGDQRREGHRSVRQRAARTLRSPDEQERPNAGLGADQARNHEPVISSWLVLCSKRSSRRERCVLLIDEIDKVDYAFEAMLLELLSVWTSVDSENGHRARHFHSLCLPHFESGAQTRRSSSPAKLLSGGRTPSAEREAAIVAKRTPRRARRLIDSLRD